MAWFVESGRGFARFSVGLYEVLLWPIPAYRGGYLPILPSDIPWIHQGYQEFPPELGNESKYPFRAALLSRSHRFPSEAFLLRGG